MDQLASITAALNAGKFPTHKQASQIIDCLLHSAVLTTDPSADGQLSQQGKVLQKDVREILIAQNALFDAKNSDNVLQEALWHLSEADLASTSTTLATDAEAEQALKDSRAIARALRTLLRVVSQNFTQEGRAVFHDFASFMRLALADAAEHVAHTAGRTAESLREIDTEVAEGERSELGLRKRTSDEADEDAQAKFEKTMDSTKEVGSKAIGAGQVAAATARDVANRASSRLQDAFYQICDRAQDDAEYNSAVQALFDLAQKWVDRSLDAAGNVNQATSLDAFINDPTPEKHLIEGIRLLRTALERFAGGKSLDDFFGALRVAGVDIQQDKDVREWFDQFILHMRRCLGERGYVRSEQEQEVRDRLQTEWQELLDANTDKGRKWKKDIATLRHEAQEFEHAVQRDAELRKVRRAHMQFAQDLEDSVLVAGKAGGQTFMDKAPWLWQDLFNVYLPRAVAMLKDIPIPRTEYKDNEVEFVLEDVDISSFNLLPGHAYIRNITDIDIKAPVAGDTSTAVGTLTRVYVQALQLELREVSFYYNDKTATLGPAEFTGLLEFTLPPQGIDVDIVVRTIPDSPSGRKEREARRGVLDIQRVEVKVSEDVALTVRESNHPILVSVFRTAMLGRFRAALAALLEAQIRGALVWLDGVAWDLGQRAEVFEDTGLGRGASVVAALWSELGHLQRIEGGLLSGWQATGSGVVKQDEATKFAMGAAPQVLSGEKHGPKATFADEASEDMDVDAEGALQTAQHVAGKAKEQVAAGVHKVSSFKDTVSAKSEEERNRGGWRSSAFEL